MEVMIRTRPWQEVYGKLGVRNGRTQRVSGWIVTRRASGEVASVDYWRQTKESTRSNIGSGKGWLAEAFHGDERDVVPRSRRNAFW
jgi:hypothetical protein